MEPCTCFVKLIPCSIPARSGSLHTNTVGPCETISEDLRLCCQSINMTDPVQVRTGNVVLDTHTDETTVPQQASIPSVQYTYYHAGPLFTQGDLLTNVLLSRAIIRQSRNKFVPMLPQDLEQRGDVTPQSIRDKDIRALLSCDLALFTYDGAELDSGTVVEYMIAKFADIPSVILRSDFRGKCSFVYFLL